MVIHLFPFETINVVFCSSVHLLSSSVFVCYFLFFLCFETVALIDQRSLCSTRLLDFCSLHCQWNLFTNCQIWFLEVVGTQWRLSLKFSNVIICNRASAMVCTLLCLLITMTTREATEEAVASWPTRKTTTTKWLLASCLHRSTASREWCHPTSLMMVPLIRDPLDPSLTPQVTVETVGFANTVGLQLQTWFR